MGRATTGWSTSVTMTGGVDGGIASNRDTHLAGGMASLPVGWTRFRLRSLLAPPCQQHGQVQLGHDVRRRPRLRLPGIATRQSRCRTTSAPTWRLKTASKRRRSP